MGSLEGDFEIGRFGAPKGIRKGAYAVELVRTARFAGAQQPETDQTFIIGQPSLRVLFCGTARQGLEATRK